MGICGSTTPVAQGPPLTKEEETIVSNSFRHASKNSDTIKENELMKLWGSQIDPRLCDYIKNFLLGSGDSCQSVVDFDRYAELFVYCTRGTLDEKISVLAPSLGKLHQESGLVPYVLIKEYVESIVSSYVKIQKVMDTKEYKSWQMKGSFMNPENVRRLAESLTFELEESKSISQEVLYKWLQEALILNTILSSVFNHLYRIWHKEKNDSKDESKPRTSCSSGTFYTQEEIEVVDRGKEKSLIPLCRGLEKLPNYPSRLDVNQILFINSHVPADYQDEWRFLFSGALHGESFSTLFDRIVNRGPSVVVCEDTNGYMFGGFASDSWAIGPRFHGNPSCFLFTISPKMRVFPSSGFNNHYMYFNLYQQTMPNGLGMGGQFEYFGLWIDHEYGNGHTSESCTTYRGYFQMSHSKKFTFRHLEVWGCGPPPTPPDDFGMSVLDEHGEERVLLTLAGREVGRSDGLREAPARQ